MDNQKINFTDIQLLMERAKSGDRASFEALYKELYLPVFRYIARRVYNHQDVEDVAQQVFLKLITSQTRFTETPSGPLAYLFTIARTTIIDFVKKQGRYITIEPETLETIASYTQPIDVTLDVGNMLDVLQAEQRLVIELKFKEGLSTSEIALRINKTEMAVRQIQCRALRTLRNHV